MILFLLPPPCYHSEVFVFSGLSTIGDVIASRKATRSTVSDPAFFVAFFRMGAFHASLSALNCLMLECARFNSLV